MELVGVFWETLAGVGFFPIVRQKVGQIQIVVAVVVRNLGKHIGQPFSGVHIAGFTAPEQRVHDGSIFCRLMVATEQIPLSSYGQWSDRIFGQVITTFG